MSDVDKKRGILFVSKKSTYGLKAEFIMNARNNKTNINLSCQTSINPIINVVIIMSDLILTSNFMFSVFIIRF